MAVIIHLKNGRLLLKKNPIGSSLQICGYGAPIIMASHHYVGTGVFNKGSYSLYWYQSMRYQRGYPTAVIIHLENARLLLRKNPFGSFL